MVSPAEAHPKADNVIKWATILERSCDVGRSTDDLLYYHEHIDSILDQDHAAAILSDFVQSLATEHRLEAQLADIQAFRQGAKLGSVLAYYAFQPGQPRQIPIACQEFAVEFSQKPTEVLKPDPDKAEEETKARLLARVAWDGSKKWPQIEGSIHKIAGHVLPPPATDISSFLLACGTTLWINYRADMLSLATEPIVASHDPRWAAMDEEIESMTRDFGNETP